MSYKKNNEPAIIFILGGSGDLTNRKLIPALYNLFLDNYLPELFEIVGVGRTALDSDEVYRNTLFEGVKQFSRNKEDLEAKWKIFSPQIAYKQMDLMIDESYKTIADCIAQKTKEWGKKPIAIFYLAVAPQLAPVISQKLSEYKISSAAQALRLVFEKPFGHNLQSAHELNSLLGGLFKEEEIYRIDHYLGKETVQNILAFRFANALFEPVWNNHYIERVEITAAETVGVEDRGGYYEQAGALRDMVQNHVLQLLCMIAMEAPTSFDANEVRNKKVDVLRAIRKIKPEETDSYAVRGQYGAGIVQDKPLLPYRQEKNVAVNSNVETYAAVRFFVDNWRWKDVPFYVRTGKRLLEKSTIITVHFKDAPKYSFPNMATLNWLGNRLTFGIQPKTDIRIRFQAKAPGPEMILNPVEMVFSYADAYGGVEPEAYEMLLEDVIEGNATLFMRGDQVEAAWQVIAPIMQAWSCTAPINFPNYTPGTYGPEEAEQLIAKDGFRWAANPVEKGKK